MNNVTTLKTPTSFDGRATFDSTPASITFRCDLASKHAIQARAIAYGYKNVSEFIRDAGLGTLPELDVI